MAIIGFLAASYCIHWSFLGLNHFHNWKMCEPVKKIGMICRNNYLNFVISLIFFVILVIISTSSGPVSITRVEFFAVISLLHSTEPKWVEKLMIGGKNFIIFINFWVCEKQFILGLFLTFFGFLSAPYRIHWPFLGLVHFHNLILSEPVEEIGFICPNNHFFKFWSVFVIFGHFWP